MSIHTKAAIAARDLYISIGSRLNLGFDKVAKDIATPETPTPALRTLSFLAGGTSQ